MSKALDNTKTEFWFLSCKNYGGRCEQKQASLFQDLRSAVSGLEYYATSL